MASTNKKKYIADDEKLMSEWNWTKNDALGLKPDELTHGSHKAIWWICNKGHEWEATANHRSWSRGCPYCSSRRILAGYNDLATLNPELAKQWNYTKNGTLLPSNIMVSSNKKVWWICDKGHEWKATVNDRNQGCGCPYCSNKKVLAGYNDLATSNPYLAKQWHPEKNGELTPFDVTAGSSKKVWWLCDKKHEWKATVESRSKGNGCARCSSESKTSFAEQAIYFYCKKVANAINRCVDLGKEIDVYLPDYSIGIEYNGAHWHQDKQAKDMDKVKYFADKGIRIITVKEGNKNAVNDDVIEHDRRNRETLNFVVKSIFDLIGIQSEQPDINRDTINILTQYVEFEKANSIAAKNKKSLIEWNYERNGSLLPTMVSHGSSKMVWWKCTQCGEEWQSVVWSYSGKGCPSCAHKNGAIEQRKPVRCVETGEVYESMMEVERKKGIKAEYISSACSGRQKTAGGYHWEII